MYDLKTIKVMNEQWERKALLRRTEGVQPTVRQALARLGYLNKPSAGPTITQLAALWDVLNERTKEAGGQKPVGTEAIVEQLSRSIFDGMQLNIFTPWGPRYKTRYPEIRETDPEIATIMELRSVFRDFVRAGIEIRFILMPADFYGIEINGLRTEFVDAYFAALSDAMRSNLGGLVEIVVKPWSSIRKANQELYDELSGKAMESLSENPIPRRAVETAKVFNSLDPEESARRYILERLVEAQIIDKLYNPIKLSVVKKEKDELDGSLKRLYIIKNKAPWMQDAEELSMLQRDGQ